MVKNRIDDFFDDDSLQTNGTQEKRLPKTLDERIKGMKQGIKRQHENRRQALGTLEFAREQTRQQRDQFDMNNGDAPETATAAKIQFCIFELEALNERRESMLKQCGLVLESYAPALEDLESSIQEARRIHAGEKLHTDELDTTFALGLMLGGLREVAKELGDNPSDPIELIAINT